MVPIVDIFWKAAKFVFAQCYVNLQNTNQKKLGLAALVILVIIVKAVWPWHLSLLSLKKLHNRAEGKLSHALARIILSNEMGRNEPTFRFVFYPWARSIPLDFNLQLSQFIHALLMTLLLLLHEWRLKKPRHNIVRNLFLTKK